MKALDFSTPGQVPNQLWALGTNTDWKAVYKVFHRLKVAIVMSFGRILAYCSN